MRAWPVIVGSAAAGFLAERAGLPAAWLIGPMLVALALSLTQRNHLRLPALAPPAAQAVVGTALSAAADPSSLTIMLRYWMPVLLLAIVVLALSLGGGLVLARLAAIDPITALFGSLPGGSASMVAMSDELGGDGRVVAFMQYTRLILVVLTASLLARFVLAPSGGAPLTGSTANLAALEHRPSAYLLAVIIAVVGCVAGTRLRIPAGALAGPVIIGVALGATGLFQVVLPPGLLLIAYAVIGIRAGSRFDLQTLQRLRQLMPRVLTYVVLLMTGCGLLAWSLVTIAELDPLTAYLSTTPGGIDSVTAAALDTGADTTLVLAIQLFRMLAVVLVGPLLARWLIRRRARSVVCNSVRR